MMQEQVEIARWFKNDRRGPDRAPFDDLERSSIFIDPKRLMTLRLLVPYPLPETPKTAQKAA
jgi:hypothetical protein